MILGDQVGSAVVALPFPGKKWCGLLIFSIHFFQHNLISRRDSSEKSNRRVHKGRNGQLSL